VRTICHPIVEDGKVKRLRGALQDISAQKAMPHGGTLTLRTRCEPDGILLVDDDPVLLKSLRETLQQDGHRVLSASGGKEGLELFQASLIPTGGSSISVVITDLGMPHVDGRRVALGIKQASHGTPVILLTGWGERLQAEGEALPNIERVLGKPPRLRDLRQALAEVTAPTCRAKTN
jgi:CheY-like chemotaxis protein